MPHALLLSPDDQAVSAITGVLEEMSVTCERPLDGSSAAQKLSSQSFDLVLVDCENLPAAKLIFDVCRRGKNGNHPVPIAIVDGRAGLPTAFRLGAELILTKPVAKDQARTTIRTAVGRLRKDTPSSDSDAAGSLNMTPNTAPGEVPTSKFSAVMEAERAQAAAASGSASPLLTSYDDASGFAPAAIPSAAASTALSATLSAAAPAIAPGIATGVTTKMQPAFDGPVAPPPISKLKSSTASLASSFTESLAAKVASADKKSVRPSVPSDDPVLAELEMTELEASQPPAAQLKSAPVEKPAQNRPAAAPDKPVFSSYQQGRQKPRGALVALLVLALAGSAFYGAWMYQPGFREIAQPQIDRLLVLAGIAQPSQTGQPTPVPHQALPAVVATTSPAASPVATTPNSTPNSTPQAPVDTTNPAKTATTGSPATAANANASVQPATVQGMPVAPQTSATSALTNAATATAQPEANKSSNAKPADTKSLASKKDAAAAAAAAAALPDVPLPGENTAIILSSKGAEKRLAHSVPAKYPANAKIAAGGAQGTIVLKEVVDANGKVEGVRLVEGDTALAGAAIKAVKQYRYRPYLRDGKAQPFQTVVIIDFQRP